MLDKFTTSTCPDNKHVFRIEGIPAERQYCACTELEQRVLSAIKFKLYLKCDNF